MIVNRTPDANSDSAIAFPITPSETGERATGRCKKSEIIRHVPESRTPQPVLLVPSDAKERLPTYLFFTEKSEMTPYFPAKPDDPNKSYTGQPWLDANDNGTADDPGDHKFPIAFTRSGINGAPVRATALPKIKIGKPVPVQDTYKIRGLAVFRGAFGIPYPAIYFGEQPATLNQQTGLLSPAQDAPLEATLPIPDTIFKGAMQIVWQFGVQQGQQWKWESAGTTSNTLYVAGAVSISPYETVLDLGSRAHGEKPDTDEGRQRVVNKIWDEFRDNSVRAVDGTELKYAHPAGADTLSLVRDKQGQCGAWASLFRDVLFAQGVAAQRVKVKPIFKEFPGYETRDTALMVNAGPAQGSGVANYGTVFFEDHAVVKVTGITSPNVIYDPSYGKAEPPSQTMAAAELTWEDKAIKAYSYRLRNLVTGVEGWTDPNLPMFQDQKGVDELDFT